MNLLFCKVIGTLATAPQHVAFLPLKMAYVASGGVIVCEVDVKAGSLGKQRLFVANLGVESDGILKSDRDHEKRDNFDIPLESSYIFGKERIEAKVDGSKLPSKLKDRVRAVSCVALSPNGRVLAVGESGYQPRILLYSLAANSSGVPFAVIHEHTFGVKSITFLPDSRHFASLGQLSDGFLHVWKYSATSVSLKATNKCSSIVNKVLWHLTTTIVTAGLRFLKVWTFEPHESNRAVPLGGRNVVLGLNLEVDFTQAVSLSSQEVLLSGCHAALYVLSLSGLSITPVEAPGSSKTFLGLETDASSQKICYFEETIPRIIAFDSLQGSAARSAPSSPSKIALMFANLSLKPAPPEYPIVTSYLTNCDGELYTIFLTNKKELCVVNISSGDTSVLVAAPVTRAGGMKQASNGDFLVYSKGGSLKAIKDDGITLLASVRLPQTEQLENELTAVDYDGDSAFFGDRYGQLTIVDIGIGEEIFQSRAHASSINDLIRFKAANIELLGTTSRDRTVQIFYKSGDLWQLLQTIASHTGNLVFCKVYEESLYVCSADRSVSIYGLRESPDDEVPIEVFQKRVLTLKNSPTAMEILANELHIATNDKTVHVYDAGSADFKYSTRLTNEKGDSLVVENFTLMEDHIAVSSNDRSIRLYSPHYSKQQAVNWGHSETILNMVGTGSSLYTIGLDGCLFVWTILDGADSSHSSFKEEDSDLSLVEPENLPLFAKVTRKILPVASASKPLSAQSTPKFNRGNSPPKRALVILDPASPSPVPTTTPRLTNATIKRIEAKKGTQVSPPRNSSPVAKLQSPSRTLSPIRAASRQTNPLHSLALPSRKTSVDSITNPQPRLAPQNSSDSMDRASAYIAIIKSHAQKGLFSEDEKAQLVEQLTDLFKVLGGTQGHDELLEKFGEQLVRLVERKLQV